MSRNIPQIMNKSEPEQQMKAQGRLLLTDFAFFTPAQFSSAVQPLEMAALLVQDRLAAAQIFSPHKQSHIGAVYLGKIRRVIKNLNACFVEIANGEQCFLPMAQNMLPFLTNRTYDGRLMEGDELLVQLERDAIKTKQAVVTTRIAVKGEYFVFSMGKPHVGISRKLDDAQRERLQCLLADWQITDTDGVVRQEEGVPSFGLVVRTKAGEAVEQEALLDMRREYDELRCRFTTLFLQGKFRRCHSCLYETGSVLEEVLEVFPQGEYEEIVTDLPHIYEELRQLSEKNRFSLKSKRLRLYQDDSFSLGKLYSIQTRLEEALCRTVWLKSGANLVIEQTESLTAIDVNTGKCIRLPGDQSLEDTHRRVNLEAAREVARQLRLRNLSGIIIVDFINLSTLDQEKELLRELRRLTAEDPVTVRVVDMTPLGLVEITRQKLHPSLAEQIQASYKRG
ncbi:MAG: ribonuclease E/G [bacterium]|nr:ribonuclease E/G [bacterium]MCM1375762.1 ribonuclease E/G [Muribaculum sp.]